MLSRSTQPEGIQPEGIQPEETHRQSLIRRIQELEDRKALLSLGKLKIQASMGEIEAAEAGLLKEQELAASADRLLSRRNFARTICEEYQIRRLTADRLDSLADSLLGIIQVLYPSWMVDPVAATSVAVLCAFTVTKRGLDLFCGSSQ